MQALFWGWGDQVGFRLRRKKTEFWELYSRNLPWASEVPVPILTVQRDVRVTRTYTHNTIYVRAHGGLCHLRYSCCCCYITICNPEHQLSGPTPFRPQGNTSCFLLQVLETQVNSFRSMGVRVLSLEKDQGELEQWKHLGNRKGKLMCQLLPLRQPECSRFCHDKL